MKFGLNQCRKRFNVVVVVWLLAFVFLAGVESSLGKSEKKREEDTDLHNLLYNTTSGVYRAEIMTMNFTNLIHFRQLRELNRTNKIVYVHRLISVPYGEQPERFQPAIMRKYQPGIHQVRDQVVCFQQTNMTSYGLFQIKHPPRMSEDCLTLNVYMPLDENNKRLTNLAIVIHVHGGSNLVGGAALFDGSIIASHGRVLVVTINYRLGIMGFLSDMTAKYPGNYGLRDQILAIKWIKRNCHVLGCDPERITLWGHSAGAGDVNWLAISPYSSKLFQRVIIQSGSALAYWALDKLPFERYKSFKLYFNCSSDLPDTHTPENGSMTMLIDKCLKHIPLEQLYMFKFALLDAPGPINDEALGEEALITSQHSGRDMILKHFPFDMDIMVGINAVEGFSFEGFFSNSVRFWSKVNVTNELFLTLERFSLLIKEKCLQNTLILNRLAIGEYYENITESLLSKEINDLITSLNGSELQRALDHHLLKMHDNRKRLKSIYFNSHSIFDSGFIEFVNLMYDLQEQAKREEPTRSQRNLFVYEYLHENLGSQNSLEEFKYILNDKFKLSTHFDGIDFIFGLPIAAYMNNSENSKYLYPFKDFSILNSDYNAKDAQLSLVLINYFTNFIKTGDPNKGVEVKTKWKPYRPTKAFFKLNADLLSPNETSDEDQNGIGIREDLFNFWNRNLGKKDSKCDTYNLKTNNYASGNHTSGLNKPMEACFKALDENEEYRNIRENFLFEYERCMMVHGQEKYQGLFTTYCLDILAVRRILIEYKLCCVGDSERITSTVCSIKNFNTKLIDYDVDDLAGLIYKRFRKSDWDENAASQIKVKWQSSWLILISSVNILIISICFILI